MAKLFNGTSTDLAFDWKKCVSQIDSSPKIRHFLRKANSGALPVGSVLENIGLAANVVCKRCGAVESELHVLLHCPFATKVWDLAPCMFKPSSDNTTIVATLLH